MVNFVRETILYAAKNQSLVAELMKSDNPKEDLNMLGSII